MENEIRTLCNKTVVVSAEEYRELTKAAVTLDVVKKILTVKENYYSKSEMIKVLLDCMPKDDEVDVDA